MTWINTSELALMRALVKDHLMPDTCALLTVTLTSDGQGGWSEAWGTATASVKCRIDNLSGYESVSGGGQEAYKQYVLTLPHDTTITTAYRVECNGSTFNVIHVDDDKSWPVTLRVRLELV